MSIWYILGAILLGIIIGYFIGDMMLKNTNKISGERSSLSDSLAKMIYSTVDTTKEGFDSFTPDKDIEKISILLSEGNLKDIEELIKKETTLEDVTKKINSSSEVLKPELVSDNEIKDAVENIKLEGDIAKIKDKINMANLVLQALNNNPLSTPEEKQKALQVVKDLNVKLNLFETQLSYKAPLETSLSKITDPEKLVHLQEIQAKILSKREEIKKKQEEQVKKDNPKVKEELDKKIKEEKNKDVEEKKTKIKENRDREKDKSVNK